MFKRLSILFAAVILSILQAFCSDYYKVTSNNNLNVRNHPSTSGQIVGQLKPGSLVEVMSINQGWAKISFSDSSQGYVSADYIRFFNHKNCEDAAAQRPVKKTSQEWVKSMIERDGNWSGWSVFWAIAAVVLAIIGFVIYYNYDDNRAFYGSVVLLGMFGSVFAAFSCGGNIIHVNNWWQLILLVVIGVAILLSQYWLYAYIIDSYDWAVDGCCEDNVLPLSLAGGAAAGLLRAICGLLEWGTSWIDVCLFLWTILLVVLVMIDAFRTGKIEHILRGLVTSVLVAAVTFFIMFEVAVIIYYTWGIILGILVLAAFFSTSSGGSVSRSSSNGVGGGDGSNSNIPDPNYFDGPIEWGRQGHFVDSQHFKESNGTVWHKSGSGWTKS